MKKKLFGVLLVFLLGFGVIQAKNYYDDRYVADEIYYVRIPDSQSIEIEDLLDDSGKVVDKGKSYKFIGMSEAGITKEVAFSFTTKDPSKLLQPGTYLKVTSSKTIVLGQSVISKSEVPSSIVDKLTDLN